MRPRHSTALLLALMALLILARPAGAHAFLLRSSPADPCASISAARLPSADPRCQYGVILTSAPAEIRLWFSEPVEPFAGGIGVHGPSGRAVERGPARVDRDQLSIAVDASEQGTYLVRWRVVSSDTHPTLGGFAFSVGLASSQPESAQLGRGSLGAVTPLGLLLQVIARWLHFAGYGLSFGVLGFLMLVLRPLSLAGEGAVRTRLLRLVGWGIVVLVEAELLALLAQSTSLATNGGLDPALLADALESSFGRVLAQRLAAALLLWTLVGAIQHGSNRACWASLLLGVALAGVDGEASHAASRGPFWFGLGVNALHVVAMGVWLGGLVSLLAIWRLQEVPAKRRAVIHRFGALAAVSVSVLAVTGAVMAKLQVPALSDMGRTDYGLALSGKLTLVLVALLLALIATRLSIGRRQVWWRLEVATVAGVLALAGLAASLPPPR